MTEEQKEVGVEVGHRSIGRLMRGNGNVVEEMRKLKAKIDSDHSKRSLDSTLILS